MKKIALLLLINIFFNITSAFSEIKVVPLPDTSQTNHHYVGNRSPLEPAPFLKLPPGSIKPKGWLLNMLILEKNGMTGRLKEISPWLQFDKSAWANKLGMGERGWEEMPYWLKGFGDLGYVLNDPEIISEAKKWIEAAMASQRPDGYFGPRDLLTSLNGKPDLWPHMLMLNVLQSYYEFSKDSRALETIRKYLLWQNTLPPSTFSEGYWPKLRFGDNIETIYWLYNRIGEPWLLELAEKIHKNMARWDQGLINLHNVNIAQGFREPAIFWMQSHNIEHLLATEKIYKTVMDTYGQFPGGGFAGDENCRKGFIDPRQGFETCGIVEFMHSFEMLTRITGDVIWADRCEDIAFNSLPAALTPDLKALHYLTCANQVQLDKNNKAPGIQNSGTMFSYSPFEVYRCCQHNVSHGWPYFAEELWLATTDNGLCLSIYAASEVTAVVDNNKEITITEETDYPFDDTVKLKIKTTTEVSFPLYLRIPSWAFNASLKINNKTSKITIQPGSYLKITRNWKNEDTVTLKLPMSLQIKNWEANGNSVSVHYGPLAFSLKIEEKWQKYGNNPQWPEWEVFPQSPWNYGLEIDPNNLSKSFNIKKSNPPISLQPFTPETAPIKILAKARKIPEWQVDHLNLVGKLQQSPAKTDEPLEIVTLIPMGAARLRISAFPTVSTSPSAHKWIPPSKPNKKDYKLNASHVNPGDTLDAVCDGLEPENSNDQSIPRFTWWDHKGTSEWLEIDLDKPTKISMMEVYWFDDAPEGGCRIPESWKLFYKTNDTWQPVPNPITEPIKKDKFNIMKFDPIETKSLRLNVQLQNGFSAGILELKIKP